jgi:ABC-type multidrug transport system fused ATPase/permease subunit
MEKIDENHKYQFAMMEVKCWLAFYLDVLTSFIIYTTTICIVELANQYPASSCGLVLSNVLQLLVFLQWTIRMFGEVVEKLGSIKQVTYYGNAVKQEALPIIESKRPPSDWPQHGHIEFKNVVLKYQDLGVAVLENVCLEIRSNEKIGIVGRTGSGKSTLLISLLRIVELAEGEISIDGVNVAGMGLRDLRSRIAIIPQEPILFVGTIRENVDLFGMNTDEEIWQALDSVHLGQFIRKLELKLNSPVIGKSFKNHFPVYLVSSCMDNYIQIRKWKEFQCGSKAAILYSSSYFIKDSNLGLRRGDSGCGFANRQNDSRDHKEEFCQLYCFDDCSSFEYNHGIGQDSCDGCRQSG